jgi:hypothetical protein
LPFPRNSYGQSAYIRGRRGRLSREWALARASCSEAARRAVPSVQRRVGGCCRGADAGRCSRQGKLNNSPALRGRCTSRCAPPLPPLQGSCPPEGGRSGPRVFAHVASVAPLLRSSRAWPHIASRIFRRRIVGKLERLQHRLDSCIARLLSAEGGFGSNSCAHPGTGAISRYVRANVFCCGAQTHFLNYAFAHRRPSSVQAVR